MDRQGAGQDRSGVAAKLAWETPKLLRMRAGDAEDQSSKKGPHQDGASINFKS